MRPWSLSGSSLIQPFPFPPLLARSYSDGSVADPCHKGSGLPSNTKCYNIDLEESSGLIVKEYVCTCYETYGYRQPANVSSDPFCFTAECMMHKDACTQWSGSTYFMFIVMWINFIIGIAGLGKGIWLIIRLKKAKKDLDNAAGTSVIFATFAVIFVLIWICGYFQSIVQRDLNYQSDVGFALGVGGSAWFGTTSLLNLGLM